MPDVSYRARGIVLRRTKLGEADLIVTLLTDGSSQVRAVAKGARKPGARLAGVVGLGNEVDLLLRRGRSLDIVTEGRLLVSRASVAGELERSAMAELVLEVACDLTVEGDHDARLLPLTSTALDALLGCRTSLLPLVGGAYVLKAVSMQGYRPVLTTCVVCGSPVSLAPAAVDDGRVAGGGRVCLSVGEGGVLCDECALRAGLPARADASTLRWAQALIGMRFSALLELDESPGEARAGLDVLRFCRDWLDHFPGVRPRSLDFVLSLGTYDAGSP